MHAYRLTEQEAFAMFAVDAKYTILARCKCEHEVGATCDDCLQQQAECKRGGLDWDEWIEAKSRAMAHRMMRRRRVTANDEVSQCGDELWFG